MKPKIYYLILLLALSNACEPEKNNTQPSATDDSYSIAQEGTLLVNLEDGVLSNDFDPEEDVLTAILEENVSNGTLTIQGNGSFKYIPNTGFSGTDSFLYFASDGEFNSNKASVNITITPPNLIGTDGNPRFNLQFTNPKNVDLDLYVQTPVGNIIFWENPEADNGKLDVDCLCSDCPQGPNENIFWENGTAPSGTYRFWVEYFGDCESPGATSNYTLRVIRNGQVLETFTGSLSNPGSSQVWSFQQ